MIPIAIRRKHIPCKALAHCNGKFPWLFGIQFTIFGVLAEDYAGDDRLDFLLVSSLRLCSTSLDIRSPALIEKDCPMCV